MADQFRICILATLVTLIMASALLGQAQINASDLGAGNTTAEALSTASVEDRLNCAEYWLNKGIILHLMHFENPMTSNDPTQTEMLDQMIKAYICIAGDNATADVNTAAQARLDCAQPSLEKAIDLHQMHMADPEMAKDASEIELMNQMASAYQCITGEMNVSLFVNSTSQSKVNCARFWLDRAMRLHQLHIIDPSTATNESQMVLMIQLEKAHECALDDMDESETADAAAESRLDCAIPWLEEAMRLHDIHIDDPATATDESQRELMDQIAQAYNCVNDRESNGMEY